MIKEKISAQQIPFNKDLPTVLYVLRDDGGCGFYRCLQPALALRKRQLFNTITDLKETTREHIMMADLIVFQEVGSIKGVEAYNFAIEQKKPVIIELDDYLHVVSPHNPGYNTWNTGTLFIHRFVEQLKKADAMTVSTPQLAREYFPYNNNIFVLPNFLDEDKWDNPAQKKKDGKIRIGWAGGNAHMDDLRLISRVIEKLVKEYDGKIKFETMGMTKNELNGIFKLEEFKETCPKCNYQGENLTLPGELLDNYPLVLASHGWDIALAPIVDTAFNCSKSDLKLKEYSAVGFPMVASAVTPYIEAKKLGCEVQLAKTFEEWYNSIKKLIEDEPFRRNIVKKNKLWIQNYWIDENVKKYSDVYHQVIHNNKKKYERINRSSS